LGEVDSAVSRRLWPDLRSAPAMALPCDDARGELACDPLVLAEQVADLTPAHAYVAGRDVGELADMPVQFGHERLAEASDLGVALALRVEVRAALGAAHGQRGERVLVYLLEGKELQQPEPDARVEAQSALVGTDRAVHLHPDAPVDVDLASVVDP